MHHWGREFRRSWWRDQARVRAVAVEGNLLAKGSGRGVDSHWSTTLGVWAQLPGKVGLPLGVGVELKRNKKRNEFFFLSFFWEQRRYREQWAGLTFLVFLLWCCSVIQSCLTVCDHTDCSTPDFPVLHCLPEFAQTYVHWVIEATLTWARCVSFLTNQFKCCNVQFVIFLAFLDPPVLQFFRHCNTIPQPFKTSDHYLGVRCTFMN